MDTITVKGLELFAYHGVNPEEKENGQPFIIDFQYALPLENACRSDNLADTVSYAKVVKTITKAFCAEKYDLIEKAAQAVCDAVLAEFAPVQQVEITLKKPAAPVSATFEYMAVTLKRER